MDIRFIIGLLCLMGISFQVFSENQGNTIDSDKDSRFKQEEKLRIERLTTYENWEETIKVDFEALIGQGSWEKHWENCETIQSIMKYSQVLAGEIKATVVENYSTYALISNKV